MTSARKGPQGPFTAALSAAIALALHMPAMAYAQDNTAKNPTAASTKEADGTANAKKAPRNR